MKIRLMFVHLPGYFYSIGLSTGAAGMIPLVGDTVSTPGRCLSVASRVFHYEPGILFVQLLCESLPVN
jgi:hypothetical protein